jgi:hypothetical protein
MARSKAASILSWVRNGPEGEIKVVLDLARDAFRERLNGQQASAAVKAPRARRQRKQKATEEAAAATV